MDWNTDVNAAPKDGTPILVYGGDWEGDVGPDEKLNEVRFVQWRKSLFDKRLENWYEVGGSYYESWITNWIMWAPVTPPVGMKG
jgi:hypothetical protein